MSSDMEKSLQGKDGIPTHAEARYEQPLAPQQPAAMQQVSVDQAVNNILAKVQQSKVKEPYHPGLEPASHGGDHVTETETPTAQEGDQSRVSGDSYRGAEGSEGV